ncbi:SGNH/GDSL hydrolase family protein [Sphingomonas sp. VNH70]|uniref:SGNH/GDSL hydrolase family protein n=1 Tax=Sphingomonas silueang TaxID=3156617 RepID=UPI0032B5CE1F
MIRAWVVIGVAAVSLAACGGGGSTSGTVAAPAPGATPTPTPGPASTAIAGVSNLTAASLPRWKAARAAVIGGRARARIAAVGDSTTAGLGSAGSLFADSAARSYPADMASYLRSRGLNARATSFFADAGSSAELTLSDRRILLNAGWGFATATPTIGGHPIVNTTTTAPIAFRPFSAADRVDIYDIPRTDGATMVVEVSGTQVGTIAPPAGVPAGLRRTQFAFARAIDPFVSLHATANGGAIGGFRLVGIDAYDSTERDVAVWRMGASGSTTGFWLSGGYPGNPLDALSAAAPELTIVYLGLNDMLQGVSTASYRANIREILRRANAVGDVIVVVPNRIHPRLVPLDVQLAYAQVLADAAAEIGAPLVNLPQILGEYDAAQAAGYYFDDAHLSGPGYERIAATLGEVLLAY